MNKRRKHFHSIFSPVVFALVLASCNENNNPPTSFVGTYVGNSTPAAGTAYPDTVIITQGSTASIVTVQRTFHTSNHFYTFNLNGSVTGLHISIPDTTIAFSPMPTQYSTTENLAVTTLTLNDSFTNTGTSSTETSIFIGVRQ